MSLIIRKGLKIAERLKVKSELNAETFTHWDSIIIKYVETDCYSDHPKRVKECADFIEVMFDEDEDGTHIYVDVDNGLSLFIGLGNESISINGILSRQDIYKRQLEVFEEYLEEIEEDVIDQLLLNLPESERSPLSPSAMEQVKEELEAFNTSFKAEFEKEYDLTVMRAINEIVYFTKPEPEVKPKQNEVNF